MILLQINTRMWGMGKGCLVITNAEKYMSEKAVASLWVVAYMAVCSLH